MGNKGLVTFLIVLMLVAPLMGVFVHASPSEIVYVGESLWKATGSSFYNYQQLDTKYVQLSTGRLVAAYINQADSTYLRIKVINADGSTYGSADYRINSAYYMRDCTLYYVSDTVIYIGIVYQYTPNTTRVIFAMVKFNPSSLAVSQVSSSDIDLGGSAYSVVYAYLTPIVKYNSKYYFMGSVTAYDSSNGYQSLVYLMEYTADTSISITQFVHSYGWGAYSYPVYWFYYGSGICYACWESDVTALSYYTISLSAKTKTLLVAHNTPFDVVDYQSSQYSHFLGGGLVANGTDKYLYFSWVRPYISAGINYISFSQERMIYNTTVDTAHFSGYSRSALMPILDYLGYSTPTWCLGYEVTKSQYRLYYPNDSGGITFMNRVILTMGDWFNPTPPPVAYTLLVGTAESLPDLINQQYPVSQSFTTQWGFCYDATGIIIMYRLASLLSTYTIVGVITPNDSPYIQNKQYNLAISGKVNGVGRGGLAVSIIINSGPPSTYGLLETGTLSEPIRFTSTGVTTIQLNLMDIRISTSMVATQTITGVVQGASTTPPPGGGSLIPYAIGSWTDTIINFAPAMIVIFVPAGLMGVITGPIGFITGALIGTILGVKASIFPMYVLYMVFLVLGILAWAVIRGNGGGGS